MRTATITAPRHRLRTAPIRVEAAPAGRPGEGLVDLPLTVRRATAVDEPALARLAALDSAEIPPGPLLLAETSGELRAALSVIDGRAIADPFHPTAAIVDLLESLTAPVRPQRGRLWRLGRSRSRP
jgi:hypothetical protein